MHGRTLFEFDQVRALRPWQLRDEAGVSQQWNGPADERQQRVEAETRRVQQELRRLGQCKRAEQKWTADEVAVLHGAWHQRDASESRQSFAARVAARLGRTVQSVTGRMDKDRLLCGRRYR